MKIKVNRRYLTRDDEIAFVTKSLPNGFYYTLVDSSNILMCDLTGKHQSHKHLDLVFPYKPKRREPKVGDEILFKVAIGKTRNDPQLVTIRGSVLEVGKDCVMAGDSFEWFAIHSRQIVRFLNKEKV